MNTQTLIAPSFGTSDQIEYLVPKVLVVDEDSRCVSEAAQILQELGYPHHCAASSRQALEHISRDSAIQVVIANMQMSAMNGFVLIEEARARIGDHKPLAVIMLTESVTADLAIKGLHISAVDLISKPLEFDALSTSLRRAMRYLNGRRAAEGSISNTQLAQLVAALGPTVEREAHVAVTDKEISATLRTIINSRRLRERFFEGRLFADPAWDILLDLTRAQLDGQQVSVSSVCIAASVPMTTALRWVRQMTDGGLLRRWTDPKDSRRDLIALTDATAKLMRDYLSAVHALMQKV